jgi:type I restriction enzyme, R subunit
MALVYRKNLIEYGIEVDAVMSSPDMREDNSSTDESQIPEVQVFWKAMMAKYSNEADYNKQIIERFKKSETPEILIVVDKLLTGFDAPCNSVLYIDKPLKEHNILQAIARVNRLFDNKDYGLIVDYRGIFGELNEAIDTYKALEKEGFDLDDIVGTLIDISEKIKSLPQLHSDVWQIFAAVKNKSDKEALERFLEPQDRRDEFYERLRGFASCLQLALSNTKFITEVSDELKSRYKEDLKFLLNLRASIKLRYNETVDYGAYEAQIRSLVNNYIGASEVKQLIKPVDIFDAEAQIREIEELESDAAKADAIVSRMRKTIIEKMDEDPLLYKRLSEVIESAIADHRADRLSDASYLEKMRKAKDEMSDSDYSHLPVALRDYPDARIYYGIAENTLPFESHIRKRQDILADIAIRTEELIEINKIRDWAQLPDVENKIKNAIDDMLYSIKGRYNLNFSSLEIDIYMEQILTIAKKRG